MTHSREHIPDYDAFSRSLDTMNDKVDFVLQELTKLNNNLDNIYRVIYEGNGQPSLKEQITKVVSLQKEHIRKIQSLEVNDKNQKERLYLTLIATAGWVIAIINTAIQFGPAIMKLFQNA